MVNNKGVRELAYVVRIQEIKPIEGYDRVEYARVEAGWWIVVRKEQFKVGDLAIYFEIDSKVPETPPFEFMRDRKFRVKTIRLCHVLSQGLLMSASDFGWVIDAADGSIIIPPQKRMGKTEVLNEGDFLTKRLGVTYYEVEDNVRKDTYTDPVISMKSRHKKLFSRKWVKWIMRFSWGRKIMLFFFGRKPKKKSGWPIEFVSKTDEDRIQNRVDLFLSKDIRKWMATEKIDGSSATYLITGFGRNRKYYVCSRNVVFDTPEKENNNFYKDSDGNIYTEISEKYNIKNVLGKTLDILHERDNYIKFLAIQGEIFGGTIQKRKYIIDGRKDVHDIRLFNIIFGADKNNSVRLNPIKGREFADTYLKIPFVPIVNEEYYIPKTCEEILSIASGASQIDGGMREGLVFRTEDGKDSFKAVDNEFLLKYHG